MNFSVLRIIERIMEDTTGGMVGAVTADGNPSVAYLPGGFTSMKNMLRSLAPVKKQWGFEVLSEEHQYRVNIEDAMSISIPNNFYQEFNDKVYNISDNKVLDLTDLINEASMEELQVAKTELIRAIKSNLLVNPKLRQSSIFMQYWLAAFPNSKFLPKEEGTLVNLGDYQNDINKLLQLIELEDDLGQLQILTEEIKENRPLTGSHLFSTFESLFGVKIQSTFNGVTLMLDIKLDPSMIVTESITISSPEVVEELEAYRVVNVSADTIYPKDTLFKPELVSTIKNVMKDLGIA